MLEPILSVRVEQLDSFAGQWIASVSLRPLVFIATSARQPQISFKGQAAAAFGADVFKSHALSGQFFRAQAVTTAILRLRPHAPAQAGRNALFLHADLDRASLRNSINVGNRRPRKRNNTAARALRSMMRSASSCNAANSARSAAVIFSVLFFRSRRLSFRCRSAGKRLSMTCQSASSSNVSRLPNSAISVGGKPSRGGSEAFSASTKTSGNGLREASAILCAGR